MSFKDYYHILEVTPAASMAEIKKAYRRLAIKFHPDKNQGNRISEAKFKEIVEAYHTLSNEKKRQEYNYQHFDRQHGFYKKEPAKPLNAAAVLQKSFEVRKRVSLMDPHRMSKSVVFQMIEQLLAAHNIQLLKSENNFHINRQVIDHILNAAKHLSFQNSVQISGQLLLLAGTDNESYVNINQFLKRQKLKHLWRRYELLFALLIALILCCVIFVIST